MLTVPSFFLTHLRALISCPISRHSRSYIASTMLRCFGIIPTTGPFLLDYFPRESSHLFFPLRRLSWGYLFEDRGTVLAPSIHSPYALVALIASALRANPFSIGSPALGAFHSRLLCDLSGSFVIENPPTASSPAPKTMVHARQSPKKAMAPGHVILLKISIVLPSPFSYDACPRVQRHRTGICRSGYMPPRFALAQLLA